MIVCIHTHMHSCVLLLVNIIKYWIWQKQYGFVQKSTTVVHLLCADKAQAILHPNACWYIQITLVGYPQSGIFLDILKSKQSITMFPAKGHRHPWPSTDLGSWCYGWMLLMIFLHIIILYHPTSTILVYFCLFTPSQSLKPSPPLFSDHVVPVQTFCCALNDFLPAAPRTSALHN